MQFNRHLRRDWQLRLAAVAAFGFGTSDCGPTRKLRPLMEANPLMDKDFSGLHLPRFNDVQPHHVKSAIDHQLRRLKVDFENLSHDIETGEAKDYSSIIEEIERMKAPLESSLSIVEHLLMVNQNDSLNFAHNMSLTSVLQLQQELDQSPTLLSGFQKLKNNTEQWNKLTPTQQRVVNIHIRDMQRNGVGLSANDKEKLNDLKMNLSHYQAKFNNNILKSSQGFKITLKKPSSVEGMPVTLKRTLTQNAIENGHAHATTEEGPWVITLDDYHPCMQHLKSRKLRHILYKEWISKATTAPFNNMDLIQNILKDKQTLSRLLGFENYADMSIDSKMAPSVTAIFDLFSILEAKALPMAQKEMSELRVFVGNQPDGILMSEGLSEWDIPYWSERFKENQFQVKQEEIKAYFPMDRVLQGLFTLVERLFAVRIEESPLGEHQAWHPDVRLFYVFQSAPSSSTDKSTPIAAFYLDPFSRPGRKKTGNWMRPMTTKSSVLNQVPVAHIVLNIAPPPKGEQALLTPEDVEVLFHETGHGLQHMLTNEKNGDVSGINNIAWDAVEFPSQFMEYWVYDKKTVCSFAKHYITGEPLSENLFAKMKAAKDFQAGRRLLAQLYQGALDLALHSDYDCVEPHGQTPLQYVQTNSEKKNDGENNHILAKLLLESLNPEDYSLCSFSHIFSGGYAAGYYSYIWAEVMSADAFEAFEEVGLDNDEVVRATGLRFKDTVLGLGGGTDSAEVFRRFRGRDPSPAALLRRRGLTD